MKSLKKIKSALISVYHKDKIDEISKKLHEKDVVIYSTGGTKSYIESQGVPVRSVESLTSYPSILGGRVKTLHPKVFGGILARQDNDRDCKEVGDYEIPFFDLIIVDLYPFEETVKNTSEENQIIEKIDIGGISLIRAAAKNYRDALVISSKEQYGELLDIIDDKGETTIEMRKEFAKQAFAVSSHYDTAIFNYFDDNSNTKFKQSIADSRSLRYGENPHQEALFYGNLSDLFDQIHGKELSYNNLLDVDAAVNLIDDFKETTFAILKHNNACGLASRDNLLDAWNDALAGDPVSAFGGVLITNKEIDKATAEEMNKIFFEVVIAPGYAEDALPILQSKKNRIILIRKDCELPGKTYRTALNGVLMQDKDCKVELPEDLNCVTERQLEQNFVEDLLFANKIVKHTKSNAIVLVKNKQLVASGTGQTSRVDALKQAITKARHFEFDLNDAVMASDAFFPFADSVEIANKEGVAAVIQPGGSVRDKDSIEYCNKNNMVMVFTGNRHFKH